ncbi:hypothetical protein GYA13_02165 [Candidatus Kuenenbacteria bacterium]|nr:hypothetical protein [Candidatus Kuenenbacteria bacterium]
MKESTSHQAELFDEIPPVEPSPASEKETKETKEPPKEITIKLPPGAEIDIEPNLSGLSPAEIEEYERCAASAAQFDPGGNEFTEADRKVLQGLQVGKKH